jgi:hypothetical protein
MTIASYEVKNRSANSWPVPLNVRSVVAYSGPAPPHVPGERRQQLLAVVVDRMARREHRPHRGERVHRPGLTEPRDHMVVDVGDLVGECGRPQRAADPFHVHEILHRHGYAVQRRQRDAVATRPDGRLVGARRLLAGQVVGDRQVRPDRLVDLGDAAQVVLRQLGRG